MTCPSRVRVSRSTISPTLPSTYQGFALVLLVGLLTLLEQLLQSHVGDEKVKFQCVCPQNGTAVLNKRVSTQGRKVDWTGLVVFEEYIAVPAFSSRMNT